MSLDKAIEHGKEKRRAHHGAKAVDRTCRNHGTCPYCERGRMHKARRETERMREAEREYEEEKDD